MVEGCFVGKIPESDAPAQQCDGHRIWNVELRIYGAFWLLMIGENAGRVNSDANHLDIIRRDAGLVGGDGEIDDAMLETAARIGLDRRPESMVIPAQGSGHAGGINLLAIGECVEKAAIPLEDGCGAGESFAGKPGRQYAA